jgi:hypothetical protein
MHRQQKLRAVSLPHAQPSFLGCLNGGGFLWNAIRPLGEGSSPPLGQTAESASIEIDWATSQQHNIMAFD